MDTSEIGQPVQAWDEAGRSRMSTLATVAVAAVAVVSLADRFNLWDRFLGEDHADAPVFQPFRAQNERMVSNMGALTFGTAQIEIIGSGKVDVQCGTVRWCQGANPFNAGVDGTYSLESVPVKLLQEPCISYGDYTKTMVTDELNPAKSSNQANKGNMSQLKIDPVTDSQGKITQVKASGTLYPCHTRFDTNDAVTSGRYDSNHYVPGPVADTFRHMGDNALIAYGAASACFDGISDAESKTPEEIDADQKKKLDMTAVEEVIASYVAGKISRQHPELAPVVSQPDGVMVELEGPSKRREVLMDKFKGLVNKFRKFDKTLPEYGKQIDMGNPEFGKFEVASCAPLKDFKIEDVG